MPEHPPRRKHGEGDYVLLDALSRGKHSAYVRRVEKKASPESLKAIADRIKAIRDEHSVVSATGSGCDS